MRVSCAGRHTLSTRQSPTGSLTCPHTTEASLKIAIVEDEVILAMALTLMLEDWGHQVVGTADTEATALALVESERPDAVLMDIRLGRKDSGLRAARVLRETTDIPIVFCPAYADRLPIPAD